MKFLDWLFDSLPHVARLRAEGNIKALTKALSYPKDEYIRADAAKALGELKSTKSVEPLIAALKDASFVRACAAGALGEIGDPRAVEPLTAALEDRDSFVRWKAASALGQIGDPSAVKPLTTALKDRDGDVRRWAAEALGKIGDSRAVESLIGALNRSDKDMRRWAAEALEQIGDARAVEPLIAALKDSDSDVRWKAASALRRIRDARAVEPLIAALKDSEEIVRGVAAEALARMPDERAIEPLIAALDDVNGYVAATARKALSDFLEDSANAPSGHPTVVKATIASALQEAQALVDSIDQLHSESEKDRAEAARQLGGSKKRGAILPLIALFDDDYVWVRAEAASAVARLGPASVEPLSHAYRTGNDNVRRSVAQAFAELADSTAVEHLCEIARCDSNYNVRRQAAYGLLRREDAKESHDWASSIIDSG